MRKYFTVDEKQYQSLAKQWLKRSPEMKKWKWISRMFYIGAVAAFFWMVWYLFPSSTQDTMIVVMSVVMGLLAALVVACVGVVVSKSGVSVLGGQAYYMSQMQLCYDEENLILAYHPYLDRSDLTSIGVNTVPFSKIESVEIEKDTSLVTINGSCTFDLYRTVAGQSVRMEESDRKYKKWSSLRFFMAIQEKAAFYQMLQEHRIPIKEM